LNLSMWRPKNGSGDMVSLSVSTGKTSKTVSTVRGAAVAGSGKVTLAATGKGGVFTVDAKAADGTAITGTIKCDAFAPHIAEGG
jgi:phage tail sheath gpL-like